MDQHIQDRFSECIRFWNDAEATIKQVELLNGQVVEPSINELRYAGRWLILAMEGVIKGAETIDRYTTVDDAFSYARLCCMQAKHDAIDAIVIFLHERVDGIEERYTHRIVSMFVNNYSDLKIAIHEVDELIILSREHRENRFDNYDTIAKDHIPALHKFFHAVDSSERAMNEELEKERQEEETEQRHHEEVVQRLQTSLATAEKEAKDNNKKFWCSFAVNVILALVGIALAVVALK